MRSSTMGPSCMEYVAQGKYMKLCDVEVYVVAYAMFKVNIVAKNFKGYNDAVAKKNTFKQKN
ncbi:hypothetical protein BJ138DRAFT_1114916 [Hygrophoropsis aurantiaca]|uniref:Uncharacterized protein n=1 Tax=Hygrophoropsis aurantiaca TaxID=72124 RepID=A0ACB8A8B1_9AGAM|nr:hypothetical protein BJ138DRAFT_1114916 [Hygrophoropsis aurantiaca]